MPCCHCLPAAPPFSPEPPAAHALRPAVHSKALKPLPCLVPLPAAPESCDLTLGASVLSLLSCFSSVVWSLVVVVVVSPIMLAMLVPLSLFYWYLQVGVCVCVLGREGKPQSPGRVCSGRGPCACKRWACKLRC